MNKGLLILLILFAVFLITIGVIVVGRKGQLFENLNNLHLMNVRESTTANIASTIHAGTTRVFGQLLDDESEPVLDAVSIFFVDAHKAPEGSITSVEGDRIRITASYSSELPLAYVTNKDGSFDFNIPNGEYYFAFQSYWEPKDPVMVGNLWLSHESDKPTIGKITLSGPQQEFQIKVHNNGYESRKTSITNYVVQPGDTFWSLAETYYGRGDQWALIARLNDIELLPNANILLKVGQIIRVPRRGLSDTTEVAQELRTIVHSGELNKTQIYTNNEFGYQLSYPGTWVLKDQVVSSGVLHTKLLQGPTIQLRMHSFIDQSSDVTIAVYDNTSHTELKQFFLDHNLVEPSAVEMGHFSMKLFKKGGFLVTDGTKCSSFCVNYLAYVKGDKVYLLTFPVLSWVQADNPAVYNDLQFILDGFAVTSDFK